MGAWHLGQVNNSPSRMRLDNSAPLISLVSLVATRTSKWAASLLKMRIEFFNFFPDCTAFYKGRPTSRSKQRFVAERLILRKSRVLPDTFEESILVRGFMDNCGCGFQCGRMSRHIYFNGVRNRVELAKRWFAWVVDEFDIRSLAL